MILNFKIVLRIVLFCTKITVRVKHFKWLSAAILIKTKFTLNEPQLEIVSNEYLRECLKSIFRKITNENENFRLFLKNNYFILINTRRLPE